jgi:hypothetical protein
MASEKNEKGLYEVRIDDCVYEFEKWGAEDSLETLLRIAKIAAKPIGLAIAGFIGPVAGEEGVKASEVFDREIRPDMIAAAFSALTDSFNEKEAMAIIKKFAIQGILVDGKKPVSFNLHYKDRLDHCFKVVAAGLEVQYGNFSSALIGLIDSMSPKRPKLKETSSGPTGAPSSESAAVSTR